jgi:hypothetical protein
MEQDETAASYFVTIRDNIGRDRCGIRRDALRSGELLDVQLGAPRRRYQVLNGPTKSVRCGIRVAVRCHPMSVFGRP